ncbi:MAG TPA: alkaline phosphatase family protein, partial [Actinomycetota bacterium]|nr:alkaline phosphatase family protein [Actinomycetota bacterium]
MRRYEMTFRSKVVAAWAIAGLTAAGIAFDEPETVRSGDDPPPPLIYSAPQRSGPRSEPSGGGVTTRRTWREATCAMPRAWLKRSLRGYYPVRSPDLSFVPVEPHFFGEFKKTTTHSGPWDYLQKVPLVLYGPGFIRAQGPVAVDREVTVADLAPTYARLLRTRFPERRPGDPLGKALLPRDERNGKPRIIVTVVWDGGGWNTLQHWPNAWPTLQRLMTEGTSITDALVGSNPSVTPAIHANIGTGTFPARHGIVSIPQRRNGRIQDSWAFNSPHNLEVTTLADVYDRAVNNRAKIGMLAEQNWHLGMIGHGAALRGADRDVAVLTRTSPFTTNTNYYRLPRYINDVWGFKKDV